MQELNPTVAQLAACGPFGFGASSLGNLYQPRDDASARAALDAAFDQGLRYFDTAPFYGAGLSERRLGDGLRGRAGYLLSTKVGRLLQPAAPAPERDGFFSPMPFAPLADYTYDGVMRSYEASLHRLGLARIDILLMHDLGQMTHGALHEHYFAQATGGGFRAMRELRGSGAVGAIGLGVNETQICALALEHIDLDLLMIAGRYTLLDAQSAPFYARCAAQGVGIIAAGVFNSGILAKGTAGGFAHYDYGAPPEPVLAKVRAIEAVCARHKVSLPAASFQFVAAHPAITLPVIGTGSAARIADLLALAKAEIPADFWAELRAQGLIDAQAVVPDGG